jgi:hypothetical protein
MCLSSRRARVPAAACLRCASRSRTGCMQKRAARIQDSHEYTLRYVKQFNLTLDPFWPAEGRSVTRVAGRRIVNSHGSALDLAQIPFDFSEEERKIGFRGALVKHLFSHVNELGDPTTPNWPSGDVSRFEIPIAEFCRRNGASPGVCTNGGLRPRSFRHVHAAVPSRRGARCRYATVVQDSGRQRIDCLPPSRPRCPT